MLSEANGYVENSPAGMSYMVCMDAAVQQTHWSSTCNTHFAGHVHRGERRKKDGRRW